MSATAFLAAALLLAQAPAPTLSDMDRTVLYLQSGLLGASCSAVVFHPGLALTAAHCIDEDMAIDVTRDVVVVRKNRVLDIAVIAFKDKGDPPIVLAEHDPVMGQDVAVIGFALGDPLSAKFGHASRKALDGNGQLVLDVAAFHGDSGGAVVNTKLELVGILVGGHQDDAQEEIFAVPVSTIRDFIEGILP